MKAIQHRLQNSSLSMVQDFKTQATQDWSSIHHLGLNTEIHFIHGSKDKLIPIENLKHLTTRHPNFKLHTVEGVGNWIFGKHTKQTSATVREIVEIS